MAASEEQLIPEKQAKVVKESEEGRISRSKEEHFGDKHVSISGKFGIIKQSILKKRHRGLLRILQVCKIPQRASQGHQRSHSRGQIKKKWEKLDNTMRQSEQAAATEL